MADSLRKKCRDLGIWIDKEREEGRILNKRVGKEKEKLQEYTKANMKLWHEIEEIQNQIKNKQKDTFITESKISPSHR
jgi:hypothetical protein